MNIWNRKEYTEFGTQKKWKDGQTMYCGKNFYRLIFGEYHA